MRKIFFVFFLLIFALSSRSIIGQKPEHYYDVDKEIKIEGTVQKIVMEPRYKNTSPFLVVILDKKNSPEEYRVELSPKRFFNYDLHQGENLVVVGSFFTTGEKDLNIIAREIRFRGEILMLRDKHGFPNRRGKKKRGGWRTGSGF
jgi:hypothetical protein